MAFHRILIAVDDTPLAAHAAQVGAELARRLGAEAALVSVVQPQPAGETVDPAVLTEELREDARARLATLCERLFKDRRPLQFVQEGPAGETIVRAARDWSADLIVIGSHGRGGLARAVMGSVAEAVMRHAPCPVLVVPRAP
ncbi:MAG: universal stress protein [Proteobacteria bacterium]|nr:universal stress protein [Pseudomonadota bacterium]